MRKSTHTYIYKSLSLLLLILNSGLGFAQLENVPIDTVKREIDGVEEVTYSQKVEEKIVFLKRFENGQLVQQITMSEGLYHLQSWYQDGAFKFEEFYRYGDVDGEEMLYQLNESLYLNKSGDTLKYMNYGDISTIPLEKISDHDYEFWLHSIEKKYAENGQIKSREEKKRTLEKDKDHFYYTEATPIGEQLQFNDKGLLTGKKVYADPVNKWHRKMIEQGQNYCGPASVLVYEANFRDNGEKYEEGFITADSVNYYSFVATGEYNQIFRSNIQFFTNDGSDWTDADWERIESFDRDGEDYGIDKQAKEVVLFDGKKEEYYFDGLLFQTLVYGEKNNLVEQIDYRANGTKKQHFEKFKSTYFSDDGEKIVEVKYPKEPWVDGYGDKHEFKPISIRETIEYEDFDTLKLGEQYKELLPYPLVKDTLFFWKNKLVKRRNYKTSNNGQSYLTYEQNFPLGKKAWYSYENGVSFIEKTLKINEFGFEEFEQYRENEVIRSKKMLAHENGKFFYQLSERHEGGYKSIDYVETESRNYIDNIFYKVKHDPKTGVLLDSLVSKDYIAADEKLPKIYRYGNWYEFNPIKHWTFDNEGGLVNYHEESKEKYESSTNENFYNWRTIDSSFVDGNCYRVSKQYYHHPADNKENYLDTSEVKRFSLEGKLLSHDLSYVDRSQYSGYSIKEKQDRFSAFDATEESSSFFDFVIPNFSSEVWTYDNHSILTNNSSYWLIFDSEKYSGDIKESFVLDVKGENILFKNRPSLPKIQSFELEKGFGGIFKLRNRLYLIQGGQVYNFESDNLTINDSIFSPVEVRDSSMWVINKEGFMQKINLIDYVEKGQVNVEDQIPNFNFDLGSYDGKFFDHKYFDSITRTFISLNFDANEIVTIDLNKKEVLTQKVQLPKDYFFRQAKGVLYHIKASEFVDSVHYFDIAQKEFKVFSWKNTHDRISRPKDAKKVMCEYEVPYWTEEHFYEHKWITHKGELLLALYSGKRILNKKSGMYGLDCFMEQQDFKFEKLLRFNFEKGTLTPINSSGGEKGFELAKYNSLESIEEPWKSIMDNVLFTTPLRSFKKRNNALLMSFKPGGEKTKFLKVDLFSGAVQSINQEDVEFWNNNNKSNNQENQNPEFHWGNADIPAVDKDVINHFVVAGYTLDPEKLSESVRSNILNKTNQKIIETDATGTAVHWNGDMEQARERIVGIDLIENEPIFHTPDRYYMSLGGGQKYLSYQIGLKSYSFEQFDLKYNRPDIILDRLGYADSALISAYHSAYQKRLKKMGFTEDMLEDDFHLPEIEIENFEEMPSLHDQGSINLKLKLQDSKYKLDRINVWVNDVAIYGTDGISLRDKNVQEYQTELEVFLAKGKNKVQVSVLNQAGAESYKETFEVECTVGKDPPDSVPDHHWRK
jgi:hypothetical protein